MTRMRKARKTLALTKAQGHNSHLYTLDGVTKSISGWARHFGVVSPKLAMERVSRGKMGVLAAVTAPIIPQSKRQKKHPLHIYCDEHRLNWKFVYDRLRRGMSVEDAISLPKIGKSSPHHKRAIKIEYDGEVTNLAEVCRRTGVDPALARIRYRKIGWSAEAAATIPSRGRRKGDQKPESEGRRRRALQSERRRELAQIGIIV